MISHFLSLQQGINFYPLKRFKIREPSHLKFTFDRLIKEDLQRSLKKKNFRLKMLSLTQRPVYLSNIKKSQFL